MRFIQLAVASNVEDGDVLYALGEDGFVYERTCVIYGPGGVYQGRSITRGRAATPLFWRKLELPFTEPAIEERKLALLEFEREEG